MEGRRDEGCGIDRRNAKDERRENRIVRGHKRVCDEWRSSEAGERDPRMDDMIPCNAENNQP